jgi:SAM-dependent methyltransferase
MASLRQRVEDKKARGLYAADAIAAETMGGDEPWEAERVEELQAAAVIQPRMVTLPSTRPVIGRVVETVKRFVVRAAWANVTDVSNQATTFNAEIASYAAALGVAVNRIEARLDALGDRGTREQLEALAARIDELERAAHGERIARLEERFRGQAPAEPAPLQPAGESFDHLRLERWLADDDTPDVVPLVGAARRVVHAGCGDGSVLARIAAPEGVGVDARGDLVAIAAREGIAAVHADPIAYMEALAPGSVDCVVVTDLLEQLDPPRLGRLVRAIASALDAGGHTVLGMRNARSAEEMTRFWRDPRRLRPVDPEAVQFLLRCEGLEDVTVQWPEPAGDGAPAGCAVVGRR